MSLLEKLLLIASIFKSVLSTGHFTIIGSHFLSPNGKYIVAITCQNFSELNLPILEVAIKSSSGVWTAKNITVTNGQSETLELNTTGIPHGDYELVTNCINCNYSSSVKLNIIEDVQAFVQMDKTIYKPSDQVKIRVLFLDGDLKPLNEKNVEIHILDAAENRIKQFDEVALTKGVFQGIFQLSDSPVLGSWHIDVVVNNETKAKQMFEVAEYVLQNFEVTLDVTSNERKIYATVVAKHTFGTLARGNTTIIAKVKNFNTSKVIKDEVHGTKCFEFDIRKDLLITENTAVTVELLAVFTEELTQQIQNVTATVQLNAAPYEIQIFTSKSKNFKPGLPLRLNCIVQSRQHKEPISDDKNPVIFTVRFPGKKGHMRRDKNRKFVRDEGFPAFSRVFEARSKNGTFEVDIPIEHYVDILNITATYLEHSRAEISLKSERTSKGQFISVTLKTERPKLTENVTVNILSTKNFTEFSYLLMHKIRGVIASHTVHIPSTQNHTFEFAPAQDVESKTILIVFYLAQDGKAIFDMLDLEFDELKNFVDIGISAPSALYPRSEIDINVTSNQNSLVGLMCVDRSVLLLQKSNKIIESQIFDITRTNFFKSNEKIFFIIDTGSTRPDVVEFGSKGQAIPFIEDYDPFYFDEPMIRKDFSETWLFETIDMKQRNEVIKSTLPDTITSWIFVAFSVDPIKGFSMAKEFTQISVTEPLFSISMHLPYSIKCNETISIPISVFNNEETNEDTELTLSSENSAFEIVSPGETNQKSKTVKFRVFARSTAVRRFTIRVKEAGFVTIKAVARARVYADGDAIERKLLVESDEGITQHKKIATFIDLRNKNSFSADLVIVVPDNVVDNSFKAEVSVTGDILGLSIGNVQKLINRPDGCGQQNMIKFVATTVVLDYLASVNKLTPEIKETARQFLEKGYQNQLKYKHENGSFTVWGNKCKRGDTWLTAFVAKSFCQAAKYISVDVEILKRAFNFLSKTQSENGSFDEVAQKDVQGGASDGIALTAYTLVTFLESQNVLRPYNYTFLEAYNRTVNKALTFLSENYHNAADNYTLAIVTYALQLADHSLKNSSLSLLEMNATTDGGMMYWSINDSDIENEPSALDIEMTAYALKAYLEAGRLVDSERIMNWLVSRRSTNGGFPSAQDTVVGLEALAKIAVQMCSESTNMTVNVENQFFTKINKTNALITQKRSLPSTARNVKINAEGNGFGVFQIFFQYNATREKLQKFNITFGRLENTTDYRTRRLTVCTNYIADEKSKTSKMAHMQVYFPSGWIFNKNFLKNVKTSKKIKLEPTIGADESLNVYFEYLSEEVECSNFIITRQKTDAEASTLLHIHIEDYYDPKTWGETYYTLPVIP